MKATFLKYSIAVFLSYFIAFSFAYAQQKQQQTGKASVEKGLVNNRQFSFVPQSASPMGGGLITLNYSYSFKMDGDSIDCYLPYYGRAFVAPMNAQTGPLTFASANFSYDITANDGKKQEITIETKDRQYNNKFFFTIYNDGTAQLQVTSTDRQPIVYQGQVSGNEVKK